MLVTKPAPGLCEEVSEVISKMTNFKEEKEEEQIKGPFSNVATEKVLEELEEFEACVGIRYGRYCFDTVNNIRESVPMMEWDNVIVNSVLGEGQFSFVFEVTMENQQQYALKCLKAKAIKSTNDLRNNAMDLYTEAHILAKVDHPHIIQLNGISNRSLSDSFKSSTGGYFVVLDIMQETLRERLDKWRDAPGFIAKWKALSKAAVSNRLREVALPVADAMMYLHNRQIVLRDLKPENIGFEVSTGRVKLFDFGLAREITLIKDGDVAGSICYMAPEIMLGKGTFFASDVHSFSIVLWELCTLRIPLAPFMKMSQVIRKVAKGGWRPPVARIPSKLLRNLLRTSWAANPKDRPSFAEIIETLYQVIEKKEPLCQSEDTKSNSSSGW